jgi:ATP-dependent Clp protease ATP-binding subunit ClpA
VLNVLLQLLDDGRLTDGHGRTVSFRNVLVIMTSNLASQDILELGAGADGAEDPRNRAEIERRVDRALRAHFRPEFLNRVDEIVVFHALTRAQLREIVDLQAEGLKKMLAERELALTLTTAARDALADEGYDPQFGARPLKRTLQRRVENPLAMRLLQGEFKAGGAVVVDFRDGAFTFDAGSPPPAKR